MKKRNILILFCIFITLLYFFFVPAAVRKDRSLAVDWRITLTPEDTHASKPGPKDAHYQPLLLDDYLCYLSGSGKVAYAEVKLKQAALGEDFFINYSSIPERLLIKDTGGNITSTIETRGYPFIESNRLFLLHQDRCGISEYSFDGTPIWEKRFASLVTSFSSSPSAASLGLLDGRLLLLADDGSHRHTETFEGSTRNTVYGCALKEDGTVFAAVVGSGPQRYVEFEKQEGEYVLTFSRVLESDFLRETYVEFAALNLIVYEQDSALIVLQRDKRRFTRLPLPGRPVDVHFDGAEKLIYVLSADSGMTALRVYETTGRLIADYSFEGRVRLQPDEGGLLLTNKNTVYRITVQRA